MWQHSGFWEAVDGGRPGAIDYFWRMGMGKDYEIGKGFLRPDGCLSEIYPCLTPATCDCGVHAVFMNSPDDIVSVCQCERQCRPRKLTREDIIIYELDRVRIESQIRDLLGLSGEPRPMEGHDWSRHFGAYEPYAGMRYPAYWTIGQSPVQFEAAVDALLGRTEGAFLLITPTRWLSTPAIEDRLRHRRSLFIPLSESIVLADSGKLELMRPAEEILGPFRAMNLPDPEEDKSVKFFPTPPGATWRDVSLSFKDGHTVSVRVRSARGMFNYSQMGMASEKNGAPTVQWDLLRTFANEYGVLDWSSRQADPRNKKRREILGANLRDFFRIDGDPFVLTDDGKGWQTRFSVCPDA